jgi:hypothetical protein
VQLIADSFGDLNLASPGGDSKLARVHLLEINLQLSGNRDRDARLMHKVYKSLESHPGPDRFLFNVISEKGRVQLDFPNATTCYEPELESMLRETLGVNALQVRWTEA